MMHSSKQAIKMLMLLLLLLFFRECLMQSPTEQIISECNRFLSSQYKGVIVEKGRNREVKNFYYYKLSYNEDTIEIFNVGVGTFDFENVLEIGDTIEKPARVDYCLLYKADTVFRFKGFLPPECGNLGSKGKPQASK